jgi:hypothetical protein
MNEYQEGQLMRDYPVGTHWETDYGVMKVIGYEADMDGMGFIITFEADDKTVIHIHPYFVKHRV